MGGLRKQIQEFSTVCNGFENYEYKKFGMQVVYMYNKIESLKCP